MSKADDLFKELNYECEVTPVVNGGRFDFGYYHNYTYTYYSECDGCETEYITEIIFINHIKRPEHNAVMIKSKYKSDYDNNYTYKDTVYLSAKELQAINEKVKELGWIEQL